jgi:hypothetical protein
MVDTKFFENQINSAYPDDIEHHWWHLARNKIVKREITRLVKNDAHGPILEIGCGRGIVVKSLRDSGIVCSGVDIANTKPIAGIGDYVKLGTNATSLPAGERDQYKTLLLLDVIEHIPEPVRFLEQISEAFVNLQYVIITVPGRPELWSNYDVFYNHFRRYTISMIRDLANQLNWEINRVSYFFLSVYLPAILLKKLGVERSIKMTPPKQSFFALHSVISWCLYLEYCVLPMIIPGTSVIACFRYVRGN